MNIRRHLGVALLACAVALMARCAAKPAPPPALALTPIVSVKELMETIVDPNADVIFDSVVTDVSAKGIVDTKPTSEEDWIKVERALVTLAEVTNLIKMPRQIAPAGETNAPPAELTPQQILAKVDGDRAEWARYADALRDVAVKGIAVAKAKDVNGVFELGGAIDQACENCHLEYWYPGDKKAQGGVR